MTRSTRLDQAALADLLAYQQQLITRHQALQRGMTASALRHRLRPGGPWQRLLPGVFLAITGAPTSDQQDVAALLYAGPGSLLTGPAALRRWGVPAPAVRPSVIDVLVPAGNKRQGGGFVQIHRTARLPEAAYTAGPLRLAPLDRVVADTARGLIRLGDVRALVATVIQRDRCTPAELAAELSAGPVQGSAFLRTAIGDVCAGTRSNPEADLRDLLRRAKLPEPMFNPKLFLGAEFIASPDAWWKAAGVAVEVDSREYHLSPADHERTLARHARMSACGITVLHFTPSQLRTEPAWVIATIKSALAANSCPKLLIRAIPAGTTRPTTQPQTP
jgi:very-short-patch-repair endonuclease